MEAYFGTYNPTPYIQFVGDNNALPLAAVAAYLLFIFALPRMLTEPLPLNSGFAVWNLLLSAFSIVGACHTVPALLSALSTHGWRYTVCHDGRDLYMRGECGRWVMLFMFSKFPELFDTVFLVLLKKRVIFLHWFHHATVLLYCWHAFQLAVAPALWFVAMNLSMHGLMYMYYFLMAIGVRKVTRAVAPLITLLQTSQMVVGIAVTSAGAYLHSVDPSTCFTDPTNSKFGLAMYFCYFVLFAVLFRGSYCSGAGGKKRVKEA